MAQTISCDGIVSVHQDGYAMCDTGWMVSAYLPPFDISSLDPVTVVSYVGSGFFILMPLWVAIYGGRALLDAVR